MKKKTLAILLISTMALSMAACSDSTSNNSSAPSEGDTISEESVEREYISNEEISDMFTNPDDFEGKYVTLTGQVMSSPETSGDSVALQIWYDIENYEKSFIAYCDTGCDANENDFVIVDGMISGSFTGENYFGAEITCPLIESATITTSSYKDIVVPTISELTPEDAVSEQNGVELKVEKVEFAESETRLYLTLTNGTSDNFDMYSSSMLVVQDGTQHEISWDSDTIYMDDLPEFSDTVLPGVTISGVVVFPALDSSSGFQLYAEGYSDNYDLDFDAFIIDIQPAE